MKRDIPQLHYNLLDKERRDAFLRLKFLKDGVLAGGTALFLQIAHRFSFDFDIFLKREIKRADLLKLRRIFTIKEVELNTSEQLNIITSDNIRITLLSYPYKLLFPTVPTISLPVLSLKDIALDKAFTIGRRPIWRDYVDLFFILKEDFFTISDIVKLGQKKFDIEFNPRLFLEQLTYFPDVQITKISFVKRKYSPEEIQNFLKRKIAEFKKLEFRI